VNAPSSSGLVVALSTGARAYGDERGSTIFPHAGEAAADASSRTMAVSMVARKTK